MLITGDMLIGNSAVRGTGGEFHAIDPARDAALDPAFGGGTPAQVARACALAAAAQDTFRDTPSSVRADLLEAVASGIEALGDPLVERARAETGLPLDNANPTPFVWTKSADDILPSIRRSCLRISDARH